MTEHTVRTPEQHLSALIELLEAAGRAPTAEEVPLSEALGRVLATNIPAPHDSPRFDNSQMDGYALTAAGAECESREFRVGPVLPAGTRAGEVYPEGMGEDDLACPVMTGAQLPRGAAAVVPVERCDPPSFVESGETVRIPATQVGSFVRPVGSDVARGEALLPAETVVSPQAVAVAASQGIGTLPVWRRPRLVLCTGGDEIAVPGADGPQRDAAPDSPLIPDANGPLLEALAARHGARIVGRVHTGDAPAVLAKTLRRTLDESKPDAVITSGGISHGKFEVVRQVLEGRPGGWFGHVSQQPGGPQGYGVHEGVPVLCLPGNPVSTLVSFRMLVVPALARVFRAAPVPRAVEALLDEPVRGIPGRTRYLRAVLGLGRGGTLSVRPVGGPGSHLLAQAAPANALLTVPPEARMEAGEAATVHPLDNTGLEGPREEES